MSTRPRDPDSQPTAGRARSAPIVQLIAAALLAGAAGAAADPHCAKPPDAATAAATRAGVIEGDPAVAPEAKVDAALERSTRGLTLVRRPDGTRHVDVRGRFRAYSVLTLGADGSSRIACVDDAASAAALVRAADGLTMSAASARGWTPRCAFGPRED